MKSDTNHRGSEAATASQQPVPQDNDAAVNAERREAVRKLGRFAAYAAPMTLLITTDKAKAGSLPPP